ncbi:MAG: hypothetical protein H0X64_00710, partial [Gemmatimonadaceae bacterium]|nr:hypothetical protein [Gemmatimonadaceae bacterium]
MPAIWLPLPVHAQWRAAAELGAGRVAQPEAVARAAATANASIGWLRESMAVMGSGGITLPSAGDRRSHAELAAVLRSDPRRPFSIEVTGVASAYDESRFPRMLSGFGGARVHARSGRLVFWGGGAAGSLDDGAFTYPHTLLEGGVATAWRFMRFTAGATRNSTLGEPRVEFTDDPPVALPVRDRLRYTDGNITVQARPPRLEIDGRLGMRLVQRTIAYEDLPSARVFGAASAAWWMTPRLALAASVGHELADLARGLPGARYATLGMRVR